MDNLPVVHTSDRLAFKRCRRKWDLGSYMRQNLTSIRVNDKLWLGTGIHQGLAEYYADNRHPVEAFLAWATEQVTKLKSESDFWDEQQPMIQEQIELGKGMLDHYYLWSKEEDPKWFKRVAFTERDFKVPILHPQTGEIVGWYEGRLDGAVEDEYGLYWLLEHKSAAAIDTAKLPLDEQCTSYIWAAEQIFGVKFEGILYNMLRKKLPRKPDRLQKGGLSVNKSIDTTWQTYMAALVEEYGSAETIPMDQYKPILTSLYEKGNSFFVRERVRRNRYEIENAGVQIYQELVDMTRPDLYLYRNPTRDCMWDCDFRSVCLCMSDGSDHQYLIDGCYKTRDLQEKNWITGDE